MKSNNESEVITAMSEAQKTETVAKRPRGGTKGKGTRKPRPDVTARNSVHTNPGDNAKYLAHSLKMWDWPKIDLKDPLQVRDRAMKYFQSCEDDDMKPSVSGLAFAFGLDRRRLWEIVNGVVGRHPATRDVNPESLDLLKNAYQMLTIQMESYMQDGKINPVSGIFLMKNNMDYKDKQEVVLTPGTDSGDSATPEQLREKYLETVDVDCEVVDE